MAIPWLLEITGTCHYPPSIRTGQANLWHGADAFDAWMRVALLTTAAREHVRRVTSSYNREHAASPEDTCNEKVDSRAI